jgi:hypothetical protein
MNWVDLSSAMRRIIRTSSAAPGWAAESRSALCRMISGVEYFAISAPNAPVRVIFIRLVERPPLG